MAAGLLKTSFASVNDVLFVSGCTPCDREQLQMPKLLMQLMFFQTADCTRSFVVYMLPSLRSKQDAASTASLNLSGSLCCIDCIPPEII